MRTEKRRKPLVLLLVFGLVALAPVWAAQEDVQERPKTEKPSTETDEKIDTAPGEAAEKTEPPEQPAVTHPSFNTIEDVVALGGSVETLWTSQPVETAPIVEWRRVEPPAR